MELKKTPLHQEALKYKSVEEFVKAQFSNKPKYGMGHRPTYEGMPPSHNLLEGKTLPRDVYTHPDSSISSGRIRKGDKAARESWSVLQKIKGNPDAEVTLYRAGAKNELNTGDWVTFSKDYAKQSLEGSEKVHSFKVKAKDVISAGDDINELGYYPKSKLTQTYSEAKGMGGALEKGIAKEVVPEVAESGVKSLGRALGKASLKALPAVGGALALAASNPINALAEVLLNPQEMGTGRGETSIPVPNKRQILQRALQYKPQTIGVR